jgi:hypothetical protein
VDRYRRIIYVQLLSLTLKLYTVELPFDHPRLMWFTYNPLDRKEEDDDDDDVVDLEEAVKPTIERSGDGFFVTYPVPGQQAERYGRVLEVNTS